LTLIAPIRPLQLCADGGYQLRLGFLEVPLIVVPDNNTYIKYCMNLLFFKTNFNLNRWSNVEVDEKIFKK
jgi:hypothetical protein